MAKDTRILLNKQTGDYIEHFRSKRLKGLCDPSIVYQIVFAKGLLNLPPDYEFKSEPGKKKDIRLEVMENEILDAAIRQKLKCVELTSEVKKRIYRDSMEHGAALLREEEKQDENKLFFSMIQSSPNALKQGGVKKSFLIPLDFPKTASPITLRLGLDDNGEEVEIVWNAAEYSQNLTMTGKAGSAKSQTALEIAAQIKEQSPSTTLHIIDLTKGDIAGNEKFVNAIQGEVWDITNQGIPFNPFEMEREADGTIKEFETKIEKVKDVFTSVQKQIGSNQSLDLYYLLQEVYEQNEVPDLYVIYQHILDAYEYSGRKKDSLVELFHKLAIPRYFPTAEQQGLYSKMLDKNVIYDLHNIPATMKSKEIVAFLILNRIYEEAITSGESHPDPKTGMRPMKSVVIIDEAHAYLNAKNPILEKMVRELRSKGVAVFLLTQGYGDLDNREFDYSSQMNWTFILKSDNTRQSIEKALAVSKTVATDLTTQIATSPVARTYSRKLRDDDKDYTVWKGRMFWERFRL